MSDYLTATDRLGLHAWYYRVDGRGFADSIRALLQQTPTPTQELDRDGVREYLRRAPSGRRACFAAVRPVPAGCRLTKGHAGYEIRDIARPETHAMLPMAALETAVEKILADKRATAVALSGGLDSALVLALIQRIAGRDVPVYTLASAMPGYCELRQTQATARAMDVEDLRVIDVSQSDFVAALPDAVAAAEVPMFNLHPVSKLLLARALEADGIEVVITGDAADQVFGTADARNYLPIVGALFRSAGVELRTPFAAEEVGAAAESVGRDPDKTAQRELARSLVPAMCLDRPKRPTYAPAMDLSQYEQSERTKRLAEEIGLPPPSLADDRERTLWITLGLLVEKLRGVRLP